MNTKKNILKVLAITGVLPVLLLLSQCKKQQIKISTTDDVNIVSYLRKDPDKFSEFVKILERAEVAGYLDAYGLYTCFAPTNDAIKTYLNELGKVTVEDVEVPVLKDMVRLHLIEDTISTRAFTDGKLPKITMYGQYLITEAVNTDGVSRIRVNRQANITESNILLANGVVHVLDGVLKPASKTIAQLVEQNPKFSIFTRALKETTLFDSLNIPENTNPARRWLTLIAESDSVYNTIGINSYDDLKDRYSNTTNQADPSDSLYLYMAYHILTDIKYLADIISAPSHPTLAPLEVVTAKLKVESVLINDDVFNGVTEPGVTIDRRTSDNSALNGVMHAALGDIFIKIRKPTAVYFDVADQPEIRKITSVFRKAGQSAFFELGQLADVTWEKNTVQYSAEPPTTTQYYYWNDKLVFGLRIGNSAVNNWIEFTTPLLVKGKYKVWICYRRGGHGQYTQVSFDGQPLSRIVSLVDFTPTGKSESELEADGWKRYSDAPETNTTQAARFAGIVDVQVTDRHKIKLQCIKNSGSGASGVTLDMIHFIPVDQDQLYPKFARDGSLIPR